MTLRLDLLRHGETTLGGGFRGSLDDPLTDLGWQQMRDAVQPCGPWDAVISSPLMRCARFSEEYAAHAKLPLTLEPALQELHFGAWEGRSALDLMATDEAGLGQFWADPYGFTPPEGEPVERFRERVLRAVQGLSENHQGKRILLVSHGGVMRLLLAHARGLPKEQLLSVEVGHGSVFSLVVNADGAMSELT